MRSGRPRGRSPRDDQELAIAGRVVHLELHTRDLAAARAFYARLLDVRYERIELSSGSYLAMDLGGAIGGGIVECEARRASWMPYIEVRDVHAVTARARALGAAVLLEPREGPAGWRSVVADAAAGEVGLWQPKPPPRRDAHVPSRQVTI